MSAATHRRQGRRECAVNDAAVPPTGRNSKNRRFFQHGISMDSYDVLADFTGNNPYWILPVGGAVAAVVQFVAYFVFTAIIRHFGAEEF